MNIKICQKCKKYFILNDDIYSISCCQNFIYSKNCFISNITKKVYNDLYQKSIDIAGTNENRIIFFLKIDKKLINIFNNINCSNQCKYKAQHDLYDWNK